MQVNPIEVQKHLKGISYPATKDDVVSTAEQNGADDERSSASFAGSTRRSSQAPTTSCRRSVARSRAAGASAVGLAPAPALGG